MDWKHPGLKARHLVSQLLGYSRRGKTRAVAGEMEKRAGYRRPRRDRSSKDCSSVGTRDVRRGENGRTDLIQHRWERP